MLYTNPGAEPGFFIDQMQEYQSENNRHK